MAQTVNMDFTHVEPLTRTSGHAGTTTIDTYAGVAYFQNATANPQPLTGFPNSLQLFCVELAQYVTTGPRMYQLLSADQGAKGVDVTVGIGARAANLPSSGNITAGIGIAAKERLEILYANVFGSTYNPASIAAPEQRNAFQIAVWELSHDDDYSLASSSAPHFWITEPPGGNAVTVQAQLYIDAVKNNNDADRMTLSVLHSADAQDFLLPDSVLTPIPEPSTYAAMIAALTLGAVALRRRLRGNAA